MAGPLNFFRVMQHSQFPSTTIPCNAANITFSGTNGVFLKFGNAGALGTDSSGNSNTMSISGTPLQTQDNLSNNFAVLNPIINPHPGNRSTYTVGNTKGNIKT